MMNIGLLFVITVMYFVTSGETLPHRCIHDQVANKHPKTFIPHLGKESADGVPDKRQANEYLPFRIAVHYLTDNITNSSVIPVLKDPFGGFQLALNYFQRVLSVIRPSYNLTFPSNCTAMNNEGQCTRVEPYMCGDYKVPIEHLETTLVCDPTCREVGGGVDADFILYVVANNDECQGDFEDALAYAFACMLDENNNRPLVGITNICPSGFEYNTIGFFQLMLHEILHALGFSSNLFEFFARESGVRYSAVTTVTIDGAEVYAINSPKVLSYGREYYNCPNLEGVLLENEGGPGSANSHWETRTTNFEVMIAAADNRHSNITSISNFTLLLLEDSGWYQVDYAMAELLYYYEYLWGKGLGCNFLTSDCDNWQYSCPQRLDLGCSYDSQARSVCLNTTFTDGCRFFYPLDLCDSPGESCLPAMNETTTFPYCFNRTCYRYTETERLFYTYEFGNNTDILCPYGATIPYRDGFVINCPPAESVCSRSTVIVPFSATSNIPQNWCHDSCATCSRPASPVHCLSCNNSLTLRGTAPSVCTTDNCGGGEFSNSSGNCIACAAGCRACTGPNNMDCLACEDETLYRLTTNQASSSACVTAAECDDTTISAFGDRTCSFITERGGGASSTHYHQALLMLLLVVYSLYYI